MKILKVTFVVVSLMLAGVTAAGEEIKTSIRIAVDDSSDGGEILLNLDAANMDFTLHDMQEGEIQSIVDESGRSILITREADGFRFDVDGKTINMPLFGAEQTAMWIDEGQSGAVNVDVLHDSHFMFGTGTDGVTIISGRAIDDSTRESIRSVLLSSGYNGDVDFVDEGEAGDGLHKTIVIKKEAALTR